MFRNNSRQNVAGVRYWHSKGEISRRTLSFFVLWLAASIPGVLFIPGHPWGSVRILRLCHVASVWSLFCSSFWGPWEKKGRG
jgi:hypothetical protein